MKRLLLAALLCCPSLAAALNYPDTILADAPCHYYHLGEPSGTATTDSSTNAQCTLPIDGVYTGTPTLGATGIPGYPGNTAVTFNGSSQYSTTASSGEFVIRAAANRGFSIEAWNKPASTSAADHQIAGGATATVYAWQMVRNGTGFYIVTWQSASSCGGAVNGFAGGSTTVSSGLWYHTVGTMVTNVGDSSLLNLKMYTNGTQDGTTTTSFTNSECTADVQLTIGRRADNLQYYDGTIDEVAVYRSNSDGSGTGQLTGAQVLQHYLAGASNPATGGLNAYSVKNEAPTILKRFLDGSWTTFGNETYPLASGQYAPKPKFIDYYPVTRGMYVHD